MAQARGSGVLDAELLKKKKKYFEKTNYQFFIQTSYESSVKRGTTASFIPWKLSKMRLGRAGSHVKPDGLIWGLKDQGRFPRACPAVPPQRWHRRASLGRVLPCLPIGKCHLVCHLYLGGQSLRAGWDPAAWALGDGWWVPIHVQGRSVLPGLQAQESAGAGLHPGQGWGSQNQGWQGKAKYEASCNAALAWQTYLWMLACCSKIREKHGAVGFWW